MSEASDKRAEYESAARVQCVCSYLMFFGARYQLATLGVQLGESARDVFHASVQQAIFIVLCVEVIFVTLALVHGHQRYVLPVQAENNSEGESET